MPALSEFGTRYPFHPYPTGWFAAEFSDQLAPKEVRPIKYFGRELVIWRTEEGKAVIADAHCPQWCPKNSPPYSPGSHRRSGRKPAPESSGLAARPSPEVRFPARTRWCLPANSSDRRPPLLRETTRASIPRTKRQRAPTDAEHPYASPPPRPLMSGAARTGSVRQAETITMAGVRELPNEGKCTAEAARRISCVPSPGRLHNP